METVSTFGTLATLLSSLSGWDFGVVALLIIVGPVGMVLLITKTNKDLRDEIKSQADADNRRFEAVVRMYENNAVLAENYLKLANELMMVIHLNTEAMTKLVARIDNQHFVALERRG
ncbi:hypothetical protein JYT85_01360 [Desulfocapsa sp. AH-315-G09]|nr:hypothetical protein [Desulfocapsa sp.]MBN4058754.1 hypothetical protein [Desulfocapsa sp. AH-315-J15]MBN4065275.1 hypothetical protein [Desulfocapsa sp. AH-315-G09]